MDADLAQLTPGQVLARDFRVVRALAAGGMGSVYLVEQLSTGRQRALKIMHPQYARDEESRARFTQEARAGARIRSEHVVEVVSAGVDDDTGIPWLAMELLDGEELSVRMMRAGRLAPVEVLEIFRQLCHGLGEAHRSGLIHRDLKPENIFVAASRRQNVPFTVKILDFGVAKLALENATQMDGTRPVGTPRWMAPEQSEHGGRVTPATDVWALGLIGFYLLTGYYYWRSANARDGKLTTLLRELVLEPIEFASKRAAFFGCGGAIPAGFDAWFARCVEREPAQRYPNAEAALEELIPVLEAAEPWDGPLPAAPYGPGQTGRHSGGAATSGEGATLPPLQHPDTPAEGVTLQRPATGAQPGLAAAGDEPPTTPTLVPAKQASPSATGGAQRPQGATGGASQRPGAATGGAQHPGEAGPRPPPPFMQGTQPRPASGPRPAPQAAPVAAAPAPPPPAPEKKSSALPIALAAAGVVIVVLAVVVARGGRKPAPAPAPAPAVAPAPAPAPAAALPALPREPESFILLFDSLPSGADVLEGERKLGSTPLQLSVSNAEVRKEPRSFRLEKQGFKPYSVVQGPSPEAVRIVATLGADESARAPGPKAPATPKERPKRPADEPELRLRR